MVLTLNDNISNMYQLQQSTVVKPVVNNHVCKNQDESPQEYHRRKNGTALCTALGVAASLAVLAKFDKSKKYSLSPKKIFSTPLKDTYLGSVKYESKEVISIGIGSCLGGLLGGALFDKRKNRNMKEKVQESVNQICNISAPIIFVEGLSKLGGELTTKMQGWASKGGLFRKMVSESPKAIGAMIGLASGMYIGNRIANQINKHCLGKKKDDRPIKFSDLSAHVDDVCVAATFVAQGNPLTKAVSRIIPVALSVAGNEVGNK